jgi:hypothetical protein
MQLVRPIFSFFRFWGEGEREKFFLFSIGGGGPVIHPPLCMCRYLGKACMARGGGSGELYVAISRFTSSGNIKIFNNQGPHEYMRNVVYREILEI